jgi:hypothetical protein
VSALRIGATKKDVPAIFSRVVSSIPINALATNRTKLNTNPPPAVPDENGRLIPTFPDIERTSSFADVFPCLDARSASIRPQVGLRLET